MSLCDQCQHSLIMERANGTRRIICSETTAALTVPGDIVKCNEFHHRDTPTRWDFDKIAWTLRTDRSGKVIGFTPPVKEDP